jgi:hypothetical protein
VKLAFVGMLALAGCSGKSEPAPEPVAPLPVTMVEPVPPPRPVEPAKPVEPARPFDPKKLPTYSEPVASERLIRDARTWVNRDAPELVLHVLRASYVRKDGMLDPKYGELRLEYGLDDHTLDAVDDPDRPTGAPILEPVKTKPRDRCPNPSHTSAGWTPNVAYYCRTGRKIIGPRCSLAAIWARALADGAPADNAVAVIQLDPRYDSGKWTFSIIDKKRNVAFRKAYADDCEVTVEKQPAAPTPPTPEAAPSKPPKPNPYAP